MALHPSSVWWPGQGWNNSAESTLIPSTCCGTESFMEMCYQALQVGFDILTDICLNWNTQVSLCYCCLNIAIYNQKFLPLCTIIFNRRRNSDVYELNFISLLYFACILRTYTYTLGKVHRYSAEIYKKHRAYNSIISANWDWQRGRETRSGTIIFLLLFW